MTPLLLTEDPGHLSRHHPRVFAAMSGAWSTARAVVPEPTLDHLVHRVEDLLGTASERSGAAPRPNPADVDGALTRVIDQFVLDVAHLPETHVAPVRAALGEPGLRNLLEALYVVDQLTRLHVSHRRLFDRARLAMAPPSPRADDSLVDAARVWHDRVLELRHLDTLTTEAARLRGAWYHDCRRCASLRIVEDGRVVMDEVLAQRVRHDPPATLPDRLSGAVMFADAHVMGPDRHLTDELVAELTDVFSPEELMELTLDLTAWNHQKVTVSLRIEPPVREDSLSRLVLKQDGSVLIGAAIS